MLAGLIWADHVVLIGYFVIMLGIGVYFWRYMKGMRDYFSGHNRIPWWLSGVSYYMTSFSAFLFVAYSQIGYEHGFVAVTLGWTVMPAVLIGALCFSSRWRRARIDSPVEYLEDRYGLGLRQVFGWANVPIRIIDNGLRLYATGLFVSVTMDLPIYQSIVGCGAITLLYTFAGGLWAATVTDFIQFVVMIVGSLLLMPLSLIRLARVDELANRVPDGFFHPTAGTFTWFYIGGWFLLLVCNYNTSFGLVQRYYCVRDEREARKTGLLVAALVLVGTPIFFAPAITARLFMPGEAPKTIYATICKELLPNGALGLIIAAMFSATMSSLSGDYNAVAAVLTNDVYKRLINRRASERRLVFVGRLTTFLIGLMPLAIALYVAYIIGNDILFKKMVKVFSVASPPMAFPMLAGLVWRRCTNAGALAGFLGGFGVGLALFLSGVSEAPLAMATTAATLVNMIVVSLLTTPADVERRSAEAFAERLRTPVSAADLAEAGAIPSPWGSVGVSVMATAVLLLAVTPAMGLNAGMATNAIISLGLLAIGVLMTKRSREPAKHTEPRAAANGPAEPEGRARGQ